MSLTKVSGGRLKEKVETTFVEKHQHQGCRVLKLGEDQNSLVFDELDTELGTLIVFDGLTDKENWQSVLAPCLKALPEGGRLMVSLLSKDHLSAAGSADSCYPGRVVVSIEELSAFADGLDASVVAVEPCGTLYWDEVPNQWQSGSMAGDTHAWRRYLSWLDKDDDLLALGMFLHENLLGRMGTSATERYMAVIEKGRGKGTVEMARIRALNAISFPLSLNAISPFLPTPPAEWTSRLDRFAGISLRCRMYLYRLITSVWKFGEKVDWASFLSECLARDYFAWREMEQREINLMEVGRSWHRLDIFHESLTYKGVALAPGMEYQLAPVLLQNCGLVFHGKPA